MHFPQQNVLAVGDVISGQGWPVVDWQTGGWIGGIVGGLQRVQTLANEKTRIVPGRGPVLGLADLKAQFDMYRHDLRSADAAAEQRAAGRARRSRRRPTKEFDAQMGNADEFVRRAFESLWAYLSPTPRWMTNATSNQSQRIGGASSRRRWRACSRLVVLRCASSRHVRADGVTA